MLRDAHEAEDAAQHAFLNAFKALERFDLERPFRHWLLRIASNLCRNRIAARQVRKDLLRPVGGEESALPEPPAPRRPLDLPADADLRQGRVREAIEQLPERYRLAVVLFYVHGLAVAEVAEIAEHFQWLTEEQSRGLEPHKAEQVAAELADALIYLVRLADQLGVDLLDAVDEKLAVNAAKYPPERVRGSALKYSEYD